MGIYALDTEMVAAGNRSILARVSIVDKSKSVVLDAYVKPSKTVTDYRTMFSGITRSDLVKGEDFETVRRKVENILKGHTIVGHSLKFDMDVLNLTNLKSEDLKDLANYSKFQYANGQPRSLKDLAKEYLGITIQNGTHDSVEDAKAVMDIYLKFF